MISTLYQSGYKRHFYTYAFFDRPVVEKNIESRTDGFLNEKVVFANIKERQRVEFIVNDEMLRALHWLEAHGTVKLKVISTSVTYTLENVKIEGQELAGSNAYQKCVMSYVAYGAEKSCGENMTLV